MYMHHLADSMTKLCHGRKQDSVGCEGIPVNDSRNFSVAPYITICPSTETYFGLFLRGAMSAVNEA